MRTNAEHLDVRFVREPLINLASGYVQRSVKEFPAQGSRRPWRVHQNYILDLLAFRLGRIDDGVLQFSAAGTDGSGPDQAERDRVPAAA